MTVLNIPTPAAPVRRGRWNRYSIITPDGKKGLYQRVTTLAKVLDDQSNLINWTARTALKGIAQRPDLLALVQATDAEDRDTLNDVVERAKEMGGGTARRDLGTALHGFIEQTIKTPGYQPPANFKADVEAFFATLAALGLEVLPEYNEVTIVRDDLELAGTADLLLRETATGRLIVGDLKTGGSVEYGQLAFAIQLAAYAGGDAIYRYGNDKDGKEDQRIPMPEGIDQKQALIFHLQPESAHCDAYWLDIAVGAQALTLAREVESMRRWAKKSALTVAAVERSAANAAAADVPVDEAGTAAVPAVPANPTEGEFLEQRARWIDQRIDDIKTAGHLGDVAKRWPEGVAKPKAVRAGGAAWSHDDIDAIAAACQWVETRHQLAFGEIDPKVTAERLAERAAAQADKAAAKGATEAARAQTAAQSKVDARKARTTATADDANHPVKADLVAGLRAELRAEPRRIQQQVIAWSKEAAGAGVGWSMGRAKEVPMRAYVASSCALALARLDVATRTALFATFHLGQDDDGNELYADRAVAESTIGVLLGTLDPFVCDDLLAAATHAHLGTTETVTAEAA